MYTCEIEWIRMDGGLNLILVGQYLCTVCRTEYLVRGIFMYCVATSRKHFHLKLSYIILSYMDNLLYIQHGSVVDYIIVT